MTHRGKFEPLKNVLLYAVLICGAISALFPFYWMLSSSLKMSNEIFVHPPVLVPSKLSLEHYIYVFQTMNVPRSLFNSAFTTIAIVLLNAFLSGMVAYALTKLRFPGRNALFGLVLAFMMIPFQLMLVPLFLLVNNMGLLGTYTAIILPSAISSFSIFLLRQAMMSLPNDYIEAAIIDGSSHFNIFCKIALPMVKPMLMTVMITNYMWAWNNYLWPMMVTVQNDHMQTMQVALNRYRTLNDNKWGPVMASCTMTALPIVIVYLCLQRQFIESVASSGLKG